MSMEMWSDVKKFRDGDSLDAKTLNVPIGQLGSRTDYLYARLNELMSGDRLSSVVLTGVPMSLYESDLPDIGNVVYLHQHEEEETLVASKAKASMSLYDDFTAAESAFTIGILLSRNGAAGNVLVYGRISLEEYGSISLSSMIETGEKFRPGRYYLSANEAGRLTAHPNGPLIYVCSIGGIVGKTGGISGAAVLNPQFLDMGTSHIHRTATLVARPAGTSGPQGYLPIGSEFEMSSSDSSEGDGLAPLALRFGGTWTADRQINYRFWLSQEFPNWPNGVWLYWSEDGVADDSFKVRIPAPDIEVPVSHGLTARLSMPDSTSRYAYSSTGNYSISWETLTFPDAGKGWVDHEAFAIATSGAESSSSSSAEDLKVAIRGKLSEYHANVSVAFPERVDIYQIGPVVSGTVFSYGGNDYVFSEDASSESSSGSLVQLGTCAADSVAYLAKELSNDFPDVKFAVFEGGAEDSESSGSDDVACLVAMSSEEPLVHGDVVMTGGDFQVSGENAGASIAVVYDQDGVILTDVAVLDGVGSYSWKSGGDISIMVYQDYSIESITVPAGTVVSAQMDDEEPDAIYDYVLGMDPQIANFWPPVPVKSAALIVNGVEMDNKALVPHAPTVSFGRDTIHWFEDDEGKKPWPEAFERRGARIDPALDKSEVMHWVRGFQGSTGPVTSLQVKPGSPLKVYGYGTFDNANVGDLEIAADFDFQVENGGAQGYNVPKRARNGRLLAGPVVEKIIGGTGVKVISKAGCPDGQGTVLISLDNGAYGNQFSDIALENAEQAKIGMFPYIRLKGYSGSSITSPSAFTATVRVPTNLTDGNYAMRVTASVFGEVGFSGAEETRSAGIKLSYNILPDFSARNGMKYRDLKTGLLKPDSERMVLIPFGHQEGTGITYNGFDPILVSTSDSSLEDSDDIVEKVLGDNIPSAREFALQGIVPNLRPGYLVGIRISRAVTAGYDVTSYTDAIGFINLSWSLVSA